MAKTIIRKPPAKRLINSMRAMGYTFSTSLADIIDNSISANATNINIYYSTLCKEPFVEVLDDGCGMNEAELLNALTFGTVKEYSPDDLGKFGLGLKAASLAQCRKLIVCSKVNNLINCMGYDLDIIEKTDDWNILVLSKEEINQLPNIELLKNLESGTLVYWENFDFIKAESTPEHYHDNLSKYIDEAENHISLVFHRFYDEIKIFFNNRRINKRDPFLINSKPRQITGHPYDIPMGNSNIKVIPYTLPFANTLTKEEKELLGITNGKSIYEDQGFYIYRNRRLIIWGNWLRMNSKSEFNKLARIQVDVPSSLDDIWKLDVKKSTAKIPEYIKEKIKTSVLDSKNKSERVIKRPGKLERDFENKLWLRKDFGKEIVSYEINKENTLYKKIIDEIPEELKPFFLTYIKQIETNLPKFNIRDDLAENYTIKNHMAEGIDELEEQLIEILKLNKPETRDTLIDFLLKSAPFSQLKSKKQYILKKADETNE